MGMDIQGALGTISDIAEMAAPFVSMVNPLAGAALAGGANLLDSAKDGDISNKELADAGKDAIDAYSGGSGNALNDFAKGAA
jgi:hypothetical protein